MRQGAPVSILRAARRRMRRLARRAGIHAAIAQTRARGATAARIAAGSLGCISYSKLAISLEDAATMARPARARNASVSDCFANDQPDHAAALGAKSHAHSDLACAPRDGVGDNSVQADRGQQERQPREEYREIRRQALGRKRLVDLLLHRAYRSNGRSGRQLPGCLPGKRHRRVVSTRRSAAQQFQTGSTAYKARTLSPESDRASSGTSYSRPPLRFAE